MIILPVYFLFLLLLLQQLLAKQNSRKRYIRLPSLPSTSIPAAASHKANEVWVPLDFGPQGIWESVLNTCLHETIGDHDYEFCYFGEITQDSSVSLGRYVSWGNSSASVSGGYEKNGNIGNGNYGLMTSAVGVDGLTDIVDYDDTSDLTRIHSTRTFPTTTTTTTTTPPPSTSHIVISTIITAGDTLLSYIRSSADYLTSHNRIIGLTPRGKALINSLREWLQLPPSYGLEGSPNKGKTALEEENKAILGTEESTLGALFGTNGYKKDPFGMERVMYEDNLDLQQMYYSTQVKTICLGSYAFFISIEKYAYGSLINVMLHISTFVYVRVYYSYCTNIILLILYYQSV